MKNFIEWFRERKHLAVKAGCFLVEFFFVFWVLWHVVSIVQIMKVPVKITLRPLGYNKVLDSGQLQAYSYVKLKNESLKKIRMQLRLYLMDTTGQAQEFQIQKAELWEKEKKTKRGRKRKRKEAEIAEDLTITIPAKTETGLYIEGIREHDESIYFLFHTEQEIEIIYEGF